MGALLTCGPCTSRGYYRADEHNARAFTPDGWYRTGDIVRVHPSGDVENLVHRLPAVARVAAVATPDPVNRGPT